VLKILIKRIAFIQTITIEDFDGSAKEIADNIRNIICKSDGYHQIYNRRITNPRTGKDYTNSTYNISLIIKNYINTF